MPVRSSGSNLSAPGADIFQRGDKLVVQLLHVGLIFNRGQRQPFPLLGLPLGKGGGGFHRLGFDRDQLANLGGELGDLHPAIELLPLGHQLDDHFADDAAGFVELRQTILLRPFLGGDENLHHLLHVILHQLADVPLHRRDIFIDRQSFEAVLFQLLHLDVQHTADQFAGQCPRLLLGQRLAADAVPFRSAGNGKEQCSHDKDQKTHHQGPRDKHPFHGDSPMPSWRLMMSVSRCSERSSASEMAARTPLSSEISKTSGSLKYETPGCEPR